MGNARLEAGPGLDPKKAKGRLKNLRTKFVSLVNVPANLEPWLIMKSLIAKGGSVADPNTQRLLPAETKDGLEQLFGSVSQVAGDLLGMVRDADTTTEPLAEPIPPEIAAGISALVQMLTGETAEEETAEVEQPVEQGAGPDGGLEGKAAPVAPAPPVEEEPKKRISMTETDKAALLGKMAEVIDAFAKMSNPEEDTSVEDMGKSLQNAAGILKSLIVKTAAAPAAGASAAPTGPTVASAPGPVASAGAPPAPTAPVVVKDADGATYSPAVLAMAKALVGAQMRKTQEVSVSTAAPAASAPIAKAGKMLSAATKSAIQGAMAKLQETLDREKAAATAAMATKPQPGTVAGPAEDAEGIAKAAVIAKALEVEKAERVRIEKALKESQAEALRYRNAAQASNAQSLGAVAGTPAAAPKAKDVSLTAMVREKNAIADAATRQRS